MADLIHSVDSSVKRGFQDLGDGTFAQVVVAISDQVFLRSVTITSGTSITGDLDLSFYRVLRIGTPAAWTTADLTFQTSSDTVTWRNLYDSLGTEYKVVAAASRAILIPPADLLGVRYLRIRSGTSGTPVAQGADRILDLTLGR